MSRIAQAYVDAFNAGDIEGMLACVTKDVAHHVNQRQIRGGEITRLTPSSHFADRIRQVS